MNKLKYLIFLVSLNAFSLSFFNNDFKATIKETNIKGIKEYTIDYTPNKIIVEIISSGVNKGEIYTYKNNKKSIYYPIIDEVVEQEYANEDNDIILALATLKDIEKTTEKDEKKYIVENDKIKKIVAKNYVIIFSYDKEDRIEKILFDNYNELREYEWKY
ncbi:hypothetical protein [Oceanivirga miroungae]|uniref:Uncharacterized protein n=1 Tax=Oceanivirga miroungae TaxID=1130046 RepID=A0A6I8MCT5_9FUSO|nr:hypothetical protein [Oceanivirga miroungae]VWL85250.1 hypothetical protein OMES3154_00533 [Oceanivirga miroungae]